LGVSKVLRRAVLMANPQMVVGLASSKVVDSVVLMVTLMDSARVDSLDL